MTTPKQTLVDLLRLAAPLALVHLGQHMMGFVDTAFAGRLDEASLAGAGVGASLFFGVMVLGAGLAMGLEPMASQALGANNPDKARQCLWQAAYAVILAAPLLGLVLWLFSENLAWFGLVPDIASGSRDYLLARLPALLPAGLATACAVFLQAHRKAKAVVVATVMANLVNFVANLVLVWGDEGLAMMGLPAAGLRPQGLAGLGTASVIAAVAHWAILAFAVMRLPGAGAASKRFNAKMVRRVVAIGGPVGLHLAAEIGVFSAVQVLMGGIGVLASASHQTTIMIASLSFSVCLGIGAATSVQVGRAIGANDASATRQAGWIGMGVAMAFMSCSAVVMWTVPEFLLRLLTSEASVIERGVPLLYIAAVFQLVDGVQAVASGALRGAGMTKFVFVAQLLSHWGVGLPLGAALAFGANMGPEGLWWGLTLGLAAVAVGLAARFYWVTRRSIAQLDLG